MLITVLLPPHYVYTQMTTQYSSSVCPMTLEFTHNADISRLKEWFTYNYLGINSIKTQAMVLGNSSFNFELFVDPQQVIDIKPILKILGATLDNKLSFKDHVTIMLKKVYAKKRLIPSSIMISLYKTCVTSFRILFPSIVGNLYSPEK